MSRLFILTLLGFGCSEYNLGKPAYEDEESEAGGGEEGEEAEGEGEDDGDGYDE